MPDLSSNKSSTKTLIPAKKAVLKSGDKVSHSSSSRQHDRKYSHSKITRSPPRRRARRSHTSSSSSSDSNSSSSDSDSNNSSASDSSNSSKGSKKSNLVQASDTKSSNDRPHPSSHSSSVHSKVNDKTLQTSHKSSEPTDSKKKVASALTSKDEFTKSEGNPKSSSTDHLAKVPDTSGVTGSTLSSSVQESDDKVGEASKGKNRDKTSHNIVAKPNKENNVEKSLPNNNASSESRFTRVLIEKLTKNITKAHIQEIFSVWGEIHSVDLPPDRIHPEFNRGYGYVEYVDSKSASDAVNFMNGGQIDGQEVRVSEVHSRAAHLSDRAGRSDERAGYRKKGHDSSKHDRERSHHREEHTSKTYNDSTEHNRVKEDSGKRHTSHNHFRTHDRQDHSRVRERNRDRERERPRGGRLDDDLKRNRRGSSGSPFASHSTNRPRSPLTGSRYRRPSPPSSRPGPKRPRSHSPKGKLQPTSGRSDKKPGDINRRDKKASSRSSSSSSSNSGSSSSSSSSSNSGSSSSSSSSSSRSHS
ncbi:unnamed protein product [Schistosoma turkestanicum]|nr:unnamed protein product [Schistosoma turkestanicum]